MDGFDLAWLRWVIGYLLLGLAVTLLLWWGRPSRGRGQRRRGMK